MSKELFFESQLILNDFDSAAIAGMDQFCEPSVLRLGERGEGEREGEGGRERGREEREEVNYHSCILL